MSLVVKISTYAQLLLKGNITLSEILELARKAVFKIGRFARRQWSSVILRMAHHSGNAITRSARQGIPIISAVILPKLRRSFYFTNVKSGTYYFKIIHSDKLILATHSSLVAHVRLSNDSINPGLARRMGLNIDNDGGAFVYVGGGKRRGSDIVQFRNLEVLADQRWVCITLWSPYDRVINLDQISFRSTADDSNQLFGTTAVNMWLDTHPDRVDTDFLLYADIDLNVVDGSSVWLTSMASLLCGIGKTILVVKRDISNEITLSNIRYRENLTVVQPADLGVPGEILELGRATAVLRALDDNLPRIRNIVVRGINAGVMTNETRQFRQRSGLYLTNFYTLLDGEITISEEQAHKAALCALQADKIFVQTPQIEARLREITGVDFDAFELPPPIPDTLPSIVQADKADGVISIGYAGKITPDWGITELLDWVESLKDDSYNIELHIVANKISEGSGDQRQTGFHSDIMYKIEQVGGKHYGDFNRETAMQLMSEMDFVWCWRPARLEDLTLELSTKLVEMVASGAKCVCYPNAINKTELGENYPFFAKTPEEFGQILFSGEVVPAALPDTIRQKHGLSQISERLRGDFINVDLVERPRRICVSGHDFKFIDPYLSYLKAIGHEVVRDVWKWGEAFDLTRSEKHQGWAEFIFCEWGLSNAVWHSNHLKPNKKLFIRVHLQEVNERARKFGHLVNIDNVEKVIFVTDDVRKRAQELFGWPDEKTVVIPNFVITDEYVFVQRGLREAIHLGMVGIIPQRKRFDRAVETLLELRKRGHEAKLFIKGPRPETIEFMHAPGRKHELDYYKDIYAEIAADPLLAEKVIFESWGNDVALWYHKVDHILSCSDFESFHYALADGVLTGCQPLVWPWEGADRIYTEEWIVADTKAAVDRILEFRASPERVRQAQASKNRALVVERYGHSGTYRRLSEVMGIGGIEEKAAQRISGS